MESIWLGDTKFEMLDGSSVCVCGGGGGGGDIVWGAKERVGRVKVPMVVHILSGNDA